MDVPLTTEKIKNILNTLRPYLQQDDGDVEFVSLSNDGIVEVRFLGECKSCSLAIMTLRAGIERAILLRLPEIKRIEQVF